MTVGNNTGKLTHDDLCNGTAKARESAYRKGVSQAMELASTLVREGKTADDLDDLSALALQWRYDRRPHAALLDDLVAAWTAEDRGDR